MEPHDASAFVAQTRAFGVAGFVSNRLRPPLQQKAGRTVWATMDGHLGPTWPPLKVLYVRTQGQLSVPAKHSSARSFTKKKTRQVFQRISQRA